MTATGGGFDGSMHRTENRVNRRSVADEVPDAGKFRDGEIAVPSPG